MSLEIKDVYRLAVNWWEALVDPRSVDRVDAQDKGLRSAEVLIVGVFLSSIIHLFVSNAVLHAPITDQILGLPVFAILSLATVSLFSVALFATLRILRQDFSLRKVWQASCFAFGAALPLLTILSTEQLTEAFNLLLKYRDPARSYLASATLRLMFAKEAALSLRLRVWCFVALEAAVYIFYIVWGVSRRLTMSSTPGRIRVYAAVIAAGCIHGSVVQIYVGRAYWSLVASRIP